MKIHKLFFIVIFFGLSQISFSQSDTSVNKIKKVYDGMYFMYFDSSNSKSTIVEFKDFLVMLEAPVIDLGGGAKELKDDIAGGEKIIRTLKKNFPDKLLKFLAHSHWHPHSISSVAPFLKENVNIITTNENYKVLKTFVDSTLLQKYYANIVYVGGDSLVVQDFTNKVVIYRFEQKDFPSTPTKDYLYFYLPKYNCMHAACMYTKWMGEPVDGKPLLSGREENLYKFLQNRNLNPDYLIRLTNEKYEENDMQPIGGLQNVNANGIKSVDIMNSYLALTTDVLKNTKDEIVIYAVNKNIPSSIFNSCAYSELRKKELERALQFAIIHSQVNPSDANSWDTLAEVYYFMGEYKIAENYEKQIKKMFPAFENGGKTVWEKDYEDYQKLWEKLK
jgi:hypothetical protein